MTYKVTYLNGWGYEEDVGQVESICEVAEPLIIGGNITKQGEFPHMAAIGWKYNGFSSFQCGGSLISERFVLTAAHCNMDGRGRPPTFVRLGDQNLKIREPEMSEIDVPIYKFIQHEKFNSSSFYYDIAVIKLVYTVVFNNVTRPACLWQASTLLSKDVIASGWGRAKETGFSTSDDLRKAELHIIRPDICKQLLNLPQFRRGILSSQMCAGVLTGGIDTCNGGKIKNFNSDVFINVKC